MVKQEQSPDIAILVDPDQPGRDPMDAWDARELPIATIDELETGDACRAIESQARVIVLDGDDRLFSRAMTAFRRHHRGRERPLEFLPLQVGRFHRLADEVGAPKPTLRVRKRLARVGREGVETKRRRRTLRVTSSAYPAPIWGFSAGAGLFFRMFEILLRSDGRGLSGLGSVVSQIAREVTSGPEQRFEPLGARVAVDYEPWSERLGYLVASGLETSWLGIQIAEERSARWLGSETASGFVTKLASTAALPGFLQGTDAREFERIHVDGDGGFVVDGELYDPGEPHILQIAEGPYVEIVGM